MFPLCVHSGIQSCLTLRNPTDCSPPESSVLGILQARTLEWVANVKFRRIMITSYIDGVFSTWIFQKEIRFSVFYF